MSEHEGTKDASLGGLKPGVQVHIKANSTGRMKELRATDRRRESETKKSLQSDIL